jgi:hypothetical protein
VTAIQFLSSLPAVLGLTGFVVYYFLLRSRVGDQVTRDIVGKLRQTAPDQLPAQPEKLDPASLAKLIEGDQSLRSKVNEQDFQLLRDALRQQFVVSIVVYILCGLVFLAGVGLYIYISNRPIPVSISSISEESTDSAAQGIAVDLDGLRVRWTAAGDPEDLAVSLQAMDSQRQTPAKTIRSIEGQLTFAPQDYKEILNSREHGGQNRLRVVFQGARSRFISPEFQMMVGTTIMAVHIEALRIKIMGTIDDSAVENYNFEAKLLVWAKKKAPGQQPEPITYGGKIQYGHNDFALDPALQYDWTSVKVAYLGPDDPRTVRIQLLGFGN